MWSLGTVHTEIDVQQRLDCIEGFIKPDHFIPSSVLYDLALRMVNVA